MFFNVISNSSANANTTANGPTVETSAQPSGVGPGIINCPYYQLYGPPPSYDSVIQLTSGGVLTTTTSCHLLEPSMEQQQPVHRVQVNNNGDTTQEMVISESPVTEERLGPEIAGGGDDDGCSDSLDAVGLSSNTPLISVNCNAADTSQLEEFNAITYAVCGGGGDEVDTDPVVLSTRTSSSSANSPSNENCLFVVCATTSAAQTRLTKDLTSLPST